MEHFLFLNPSANYFAGAGVVAGFAAGFAAGAVVAGFAAGFAVVLAAGFAGVAAGAAAGVAVLAAGASVLAAVLAAGFAGVCADPANTKPKIQAEINANFFMILFFKLLLITKQMYGNENQSTVTNLLMRC